jgi:hypothetical protein
MKLSLFFLVFVMAMAAQDPSQPLPSADRVVAEMRERDNLRRAAFHGYTAVRRYVLENSHHHKRAEMLVTARCLDDGSKQFQTVSATGWAAARSHVFPRLLEGEREASQPGVRERSNITPANYSFEMVGRDYINQRAAYVLAITPKTHNQYLVEGRIWVDADDYAIARIEGKPAKNPSFWIKTVHFVHTYQKSGLIWLPVSDRSVTDARIIGATELTIEYLDYTPDAATVSAFRQPPPRSHP